MISGKDLLNQFKAASWRSPDEVERFVAEAEAPQAGELLKYQADNRLDGVPRAQVATDLAVIYLMDKKPEQAER